MLTVINYHYIENISRADECKGIVPTWLNDFIEQIKWLKNKFSFIPVSELVSKSSEELLEIVHSKEMFCLLTFDDASRNQIMLGGEIMDDHNVDGICFVIGSVIQDQAVPLTFVIHAALSVCSSNEILRSLNDYGLCGIDYDEKILKESACYFYEKDIERRYVKYLINQVLAIKTYQLTKDALLAVIKEHFGSEKELCSQWFATKEELMEYENIGNVIGNHGFSHKDYLTLSHEGALDDVLLGHTVISSITNNEINCYAYPFGCEDDAVKKTIKDDLLKNNYKMIFGINTDINFIDNSLCDLRRYDANLDLLPFGYKLEQRLEEIGKK